MPNQEQCKKCGQVVTVPNSANGTIDSCPKCGDTLIFSAKETAANSWVQTPPDPSKPFILEIWKDYVELPSDACACCLAPPTEFIPVQAKQIPLDLSETNWLSQDNPNTRIRTVDLNWMVPYCSSCAKHVRNYHLAHRIAKTAGTLSVVGVILFYAIPIWKAAFANPDSLGFEILKCMGLSVLVGFGVWLLLYFLLPDVLCYKGPYCTTRTVAIMPFRSNSMCRRPRYWFSNSTYGQRTADTNRMTH